MRDSCLGLGILYTSKFYGFGARYRSFLRCYTQWLRCNTSMGGVMQGVPFVLYCDSRPCTFPFLPLSWISYMILFPLYSYRILTWLYTILTILRIHAYSLWMSADSILGSTRVAETISRNSFYVELGVQSPPEQQKLGWKGFCKTSFQAGMDF